LFSSRNVRLFVLSAVSAASGISRTADTVPSNGASETTLSCTVPAVPCAGTVAAIVLVSGAPALSAIG
jgi:hypothetical protein